VSSACPVVSIQGGDGHWVGSCCGTHERAMRAVLDHAAGAADRVGVLPRRGHRALRHSAGALHDRPGGGRRRALSLPPAEEQRPGASRADCTPGPSVPRRVDRRKGALDLLDAVATMHTDVRVVMSGIGPDFEPARAKTIELSLDAQFPGIVDYERVPNVYDDCDGRRTSGRRRSWAWTSSSTSTCLRRPIVATTPPRPSSGRCTTRSSGGEAAMRAALGGALERIL